MVLADIWSLFSDPGALAVFMAFLLPIIAILATTWRSIERTRSNDRLKQSMVEHGYTPEQMQRILSMRSDDRRHREQ